MCRCVVVPVVVVCGHFCPVVLVNNNDVTGDRREVAAMFCLPLLRPDW